MEQCNPVHLSQAAPSASTVASVTDRVHPVDQKSSYLARQPGTCNP